MARRVLLHEEAMSTLLKSRLKLLSRARQPLQLEATARLFLLNQNADTTAFVQTCVLHRATVFD